MRAIEHLTTVIAWCASKKITVIFTPGARSLWDPNTCTITINSRITLERRLHVLLHECGHYLTGSPSPTERFGRGHQASSEVKRTMVHRVDVVDEELEAWARGLDLSKRLSITIDLDRYNRTRTEYVRTYLQWAAGVGDWEPERDDDG